MQYQVCLPTPARTIFLPSSRRQLGQFYQSAPTPAQTIFRRSSRRQLGQFSRAARETDASSVNFLSNFRHQLGQLFRCPSKPTPARTNFHAVYPSSLFCSSRHCSSKALQLIAAQKHCSSVASLHRSSLDWLNGIAALWQCTSMVLHRRDGERKYYRPATVERPGHEDLSHSREECLFACTHLDRRVIRGRRFRALQSYDVTLT